MRSDLNGTVSELLDRFDGYTVHLFAGEGDWYNSPDEAIDSIKETSKTIKDSGVLVSSAWFKLQEVIPFKQLDIAMMRDDRLDPQNVQVESVFPEGQGVWEGPTQQSYNEPLRGRYRQDESATTEVSSDQLPANPSDVDIDGAMDALVRLSELDEELIWKIFYEQIPEGTLPDPTESDTFDFINARLNWLAEHLAGRSYADIVQELKTASDESVLDLISGG